LVEVRMIIILEYIIDLSSGNNRVELEVRSDVDEYRKKIEEYE